MTMATDTVGQFRPALSVTWQADVMQNVTDAGLVPGRKQNTMGLEAGSQETVKYVVSDRTPQSIDTVYNPETRSQTQNRKHFSNEEEQTQPHCCSYNKWTHLETFLQASAFKIIQGKSMNLFK